MRVSPSAITYTVRYLQQQDVHNRHTIRASIMSTMDIAPYVQQAMVEQPDSFRSSLIAAMVYQQDIHTSNQPSYMRRKHT